MKKHKDILTGAILFTFLISADQAVKYLIRSSGGFYICNPNMAFGVKIPSILFWIIWTVIILLVSLKIFNFKFFPPSRDPAKAVTVSNKFLNFQFLGLLFVFSGALSNIIDRLRFGCVIDFINIGFWPVFNLADVFITVGVILLIMQNLRIKRSN